jgi:uncharacterized membrane protein YccC
MPRPDTANAGAPDLPSGAAFGWRARMRLLASDLLVFDLRQLGWRLALRGTTGLLLPLILALLFDMPPLNWVGIGAFLLAIGDSTDDGDRAQLLRLALGALLGGFSLATGVLGGENLFLAVLGMLFWAALAGLMGVYGNAFATMGLPIAWAYVELGLPTRDHSLANAIALGSLFVLGGGLTMVLTWMVRVAGPYGPLRYQTVACFRAVAAYFDVIGQERDDDPGRVISPETRLRATLAEARRIAAQLRRRQHGSSQAGQRLVMLIEIADRLFSLAAVLRERPADEQGLFFVRPGSIPLALLRDTALQVAASLPGPVQAKPLRDALAQLDALGMSIEDALGHDDARPPPAAARDRVSTFGIGDVSHRMARELAHALRILIGDSMLPVALEQPAPARAGLSAALAPLATCLDRDSVVTRHALRFAVVSAVAVMIFWVFPPPFGYWIPLTVTVVLKPYAGTTLERTVQRIVGTVAGILLASALMPFLTAPQTQLAAVAFAFFWLMATIPFNYGLAIFFLSAGLIPFEHLLMPHLDQEVGLLRLAGTGIGAVLAVVAGHLLWPTFERNSLPALLRSCVRSMTLYADRVLTAVSGAYDPRSIEAVRRQTGLDITNLQAAVQHSVTEFGGDPAALDSTVRASVALQRMSLSLNALVNAAPATASLGANLGSFRIALVSTLNQLSATAEAPAPASWPDLPSTMRASRQLAAVNTAGGAAEAAAADFLRCELDRMVSQIEMLHDAAGPLLNAQHAPRKA